MIFISEIGKLLAHSCPLSNIMLFESLSLKQRKEINDSNNQKLPNKDSHTGNVIVAVRPENIALAEDGELQGEVFSKFYLGDCNDLRVKIGSGNILRVLARASTYNTLDIGEKVKLKVLEYFVFEDDGRDQTKIMT